MQIFSIFCTVSTYYKWSWIGWGENVSKNSGDILSTVFAESMAPAEMIPWNFQASNSPKRHMNTDIDRHWYTLVMPKLQAVFLVMTFFSLNMIYGSGQKLHLLTSKYYHNIT